MPPRRTERRAGGMAEQKDGNGTAYDHHDPARGSARRMRRLVDIRPQRASRLLLGALPIVALLLVYLLASEARHAANPADKVLPTFAAMAQAAHDFTTQRDPATDRILLVADTLASLYRQVHDHAARLRSYEIVASLKEDVAAAKV